MHFEIYVSGTGKFVFIVDSHPRDTVGFVKWGSYADVIKSWRNSKPAVFPQEALSEEPVQMPTTPRNLFLQFCLRKDHIQIPTLPLANKEGSMHLGWTFQEFVGYRNRPQKNKQLRQSVGSWRTHRALLGLASLLMWIRLQIWGKKLLLCSRCTQWQTSMVFRGSRWAPKWADNFPFACSLSFCNYNQDWSSGHAIICLKGQDE